MNHNQIKEKIFSFYDDELDSVIKSQIGTHLKACEECRGLLKKWEELRVPLSKMAPPLASEDFVTSVMNQIEELEAPVEKPTKIWKVLDWLFPTLGYGVAFALIFMVVDVSPSSFSETTESILLPDVHDPVQWFFSNDANQPLPLLGAEEELL